MGVSHGGKKLGKFSHCQLLLAVLTAAKAMSLEERVARKVVSTRGSGQQLGEISDGARHCLDTRGAPLHSRVTSPTGLVPPGHSAGVQGTGVRETLV